MLELFRRYSGPYRKYFVVGPACKLIEVLFDLFTPLVIARMIDHGVGARDVHAVVTYGLLLVAMAALGILFTLVCQKMACLLYTSMPPSTTLVIRRAKALLSQKPCLTGAMSWQVILINIKIFQRLSLIHIYRLAYLHRSRRKDRSRYQQI